MIGQGLLFAVIGMASIWIGWTFRNKAEATADKYDKLSRQIADPIASTPPVTFGPRYYRITGPLLIGLGVLLVLAGLLIAIFGGA
jgi:hypothetical protein